MKTIALIITLSTAFGVLIRDVAQDYRDPPAAAQCSYSQPKVTRDILPSMDPLIEKVCAHYRATGRGFICRRVEL
jgi:hypothetical protein